MRAVTFHAYGGPEQLRLTDIPRPMPGKGQVLVRVGACALNGSDKEYLTGSPFYARLNGLFRPRRKVLGSDIAGEIEALGQGVTGFAVGDRVMADNLERLGGLAEFVLVPSDRLVPTPPSLTDSEAACLPQPAAIAWAGLHDVGDVQAGQNVLINGAGGAGGVLAVQLAKRAGAIVTAVDRADTHTVLRQLGADRVLDFRDSDFTAEPERYDLILDLVATRPARAIFPVLTATGRYLAVGGPVPVLLNLLVAGWLGGRSSRKRVGILTAPPDTGRVRKVLALVETGEVKIQIGGTYPLERAAEAFADMIGGRMAGKVVITL